MPIKVQKDLPAMKVIKDSISLDWTEDVIVKKNSQIDNKMTTTYQLIERMYGY